MRRLVSSGLVVFMGFVCLPVAISHRQTWFSEAPKPATVNQQTDPRLGLLHRFFERAHSPIKALAHVFLESADEFALDWRLLPSISLVESGAGRVAPHNNLFGWNCGQAGFPSMAASIHEVGFQLSHSRLYRGKNTHQILTTYNSNPEYAVKVKSVMQQIAPTE